MTCVTSGKVTLLSNVRCTNHHSPSYTRSFKNVNYSLVLGQEPLLGDQHDLIFTFKLNCQIDYYVMTSPIPVSQCCWCVVDPGQTESWRGHCIGHSVIKCDTMCNYLGQVCLVTDWFQVTRSWMMAIEGLLSTASMDRDWIQSLLFKLYAYSVMKVARPPRASFCFCTRQLQLFTYAWSGFVLFWRIQDPGDLWLKAIRLGSW